MEREEVSEVGNRLSVRIRQASEPGLALPLREFRVHRGRLDSMLLTCVSSDFKSIDRS